MLLESTNLHSVCRIICRISWKGCVICFYTSIFQVPLDWVFQAVKHPFQYEDQHSISPCKWSLLLFPVIYCSAEMQSKIFSQASGKDFGQKNCLPFPCARFLKFIFVFKQLQFVNNISQLGANMEAAFLNSLSTTLAWDNYKNRCDSFVIF